MPRINSSSILAATILSGLLFSANANAGYVTDAHGNIGYDTAAECDAAVQAGVAKFYESFTDKSPLLRSGEVSVKSAQIKDLGDQYRMGACDLGVAKKLGRDGVSSKLQGKYVPYSPNMPINVYLNQDGKPVRVSMRRCDNWFSSAAPRPVAISTPKEQPQPTPQKPIVKSDACCIKPYVFGTLGVLNDGARYDGNQVISQRDQALAGQLGVGARIGSILGAELFYQNGHRLALKADNGYEVKMRNETYGARLTAGTQLTQDVRVFGKLGAAIVRHRNVDNSNWDQTSTSSYRSRQVRATAGLGLTYALNNQLSLRADYDHYFKRNKNHSVFWKSGDYLGLGLQYSF